MKGEINRERIVGAALDLIEERGGSHSVSLREVSRRIGCSAPNIYNYFSDFASLLNAVHRHIIDDLSTEIAKSVTESPSPFEAFRAAAGAFICFALDHRGWFNCYHFEKHAPPIEPETESFAVGFGGLMIGIVRKAAPASISARKAGFVTRAIHRYILGELATVVIGKDAPADDGKFAKGLERTCVALFWVLMKGPEPGKKEVLYYGE
jgi:AcrR family transcriptional regulator